MTRALAAVVALFALACDTSACKNGAFQCSTDGTILEECIEGVWTESEDCGAQKLMCHAEMGHCMTMGGTTE